MCVKPFDWSCLGQDVWTWIAVIALVLALLFLFS